MGLIRRGALRGWGRLWGTAENQDPPLRIDGQSQIQPVYDVGPAAHWQSPHLFNGWIWLDLITVSAGIGTETLELDLDDALAAAAGLIGGALSAEQLQDSRPWICEAQLEDTAGVGTVTGWQLYLQTNGIEPQLAGDGWFLIGAGDDGAEFTSPSGALIQPQCTFFQTVGSGLTLPLEYRAIRVPQACPVQIMVDYSGVGGSFVRLLLWLGADGGPPPGRG